MAVGFEELEVWKSSGRLAVDVLRAFRDCRDPVFKQQVCGSALAVPGSIAQGYERNSPEEFGRLLAAAKGLAGEVRTFLYLARDLGFVGKPESNDLLEETRKVSAMLGALIRSRRKNGEGGKESRGRRADWAKQRTAD